MGKNVKSKATALPVSVYDEETRSVVHRCRTVKEAEDYIAALPDRAKVERGGYGIDAPEEVVNPRK